MNDANTFDFVECPTCFTSVQSDLLIPAGGTHICANCRDDYAQRIKEGVATPQTSEWVAIREEHIKHEASLRSIGLLYYLAGGFMCLGGFGSLFAILGSGSLGGEAAPIVMGMVTFYLVFGVGSIFIGRGIRKLRPWVKIPVTIFSGLGLLSIPIGTLINGYILYLVYSQKGKLIFSPEYAEIREATPEVVYKTSKLVWAILILLLLGLVALVISLWYSQP